MFIFHECVSKDPSRSSAIVFCKSYYKYSLYQHVCVNYSDTGGSPFTGALVDNAEVVMIMGSVS